MRLRVASSPHLPPEPVVRFRVAPYLAWLSRVGDEVRGCPFPSVLRPCRLWILGLPRLANVFRARGLSDSPGFPDSSRLHCGSDAFLGLPLVLHLRLCQRWSPELPRISHPSAVPTDRSPGCPEFRSLGIADDPFLRLPRFPNLPAPADVLPSYPGVRTIRFASGFRSGSPRIFPLRLHQRIELPGCPGSSFLWRR